MAKTFEKMTRSEHLLAAAMAVEKAMEELKKAHNALMVGDRHQKAMGGFTDCRDFAKEILLLISSDNGECGLNALARAFRNKSQQEA